MARRKYKYRRRTPITLERKARSLQGAWRKATNRTATLTIDKAKAIIKKPPVCPYCDNQIQWQTLSVDHVIPKSRDGESTPSNLVFACRECNTVKGNLTGDEFRFLMEFLNKHPKMRSYLIPRLKAGGAVFGRRRRRR